MKRRILTGLLCICMIMTLLPVGAAEAADDGAVVPRNSVLDLTDTNGSYESTSGPKTGVDFTTTSINDSAEGWSWDVDSKTLTLSGAQIEISSENVSSNKSTGINLPGSTTVNIILEAGTSSKIQGGDIVSESGAESYGILSFNSKIIISGSGSLEVNGGNAQAGGTGMVYNYGISTKLTVITEDATVKAAGGSAKGNVTAYSAGFYGGVEIKDNANVEAKGGDVEAGSNGGGFYVESHGIRTTDFSKVDRVVTISGHAKLVAEGGNATKASGGGFSYSSGIYSTSIIIEDYADVVAKGNSAIAGQGYSCGLFVNDTSGNNISIRGNSNVNANGGSAETGSIGIRAKEGSGGNNIVSISDNAIVSTTGNGRASGTSSVNFYSIGIGSELVDISGGIISAIGNGEALDDSDELFYSNGINGKVVTIKGGEVSASGKVEAINTKGLSSVTVKVSPDEALKMKIGVKTGDSQTSAAAITGSPFSAEQDITGLVQNKKYFQSKAGTAIAATPKALDFGSVYPDYSQPQEKTVIIKNSGDTAVTLNDTASDIGDFIISGLSNTTLGAGSEAIFTVRPKADLGSGTYTDIINITGDNDAQAAVSLSFTVEEKAIVSGVNSDDAKTIWYGKNGSDPIAWRVVGLADQGVAPTSGNITLLSKESLGSTKFAWTDNNVYSASALKTEIEKIVDNFSGSERTAISSRDLVVGEYKPTAPYSDGIAGEMVSDALLWPLSTAEANILNAFIRKIGVFWWLRSPGAYSYSSAYVDSSGMIKPGGQQCRYYSYVVRPAFHLKQDSIVFSSAAVGGKVSGPIGENALMQFADSTAYELKLTIYDNAYDNFGVSDIVFDGKQVSFSYSGAAVYSGAALYSAETDTNEYISAIVKNEIGEITYYGNIVQPVNESGTAKINLPEDFDTNKDKLYIFSEQCNGDKMTDYAGELKLLSENAYPIFYELSNLTTDGDFYYLYSGTEAYTAILTAESGYNLPESITIEVGGTVLGQDDYSYSDSSGELSIPRDKITGPVIITAKGLLESGGGIPYTYYTITATAEKGGSISPSGDVSVSKGGDKTFTIKADEGYAVLDVLIDGKNVGNVGSYTFKNISESHTITARFTEEKTKVPEDIFESDWFYTDVMWAYENGLMTGTSGTAFSPGLAMTRGMLVTVLWRMEGSPKVSEMSEFSDVAGGAWYSDAVAWAAANEIVNGYGNGSFGPDDTISREQMAAILFRYAKHKGYDVSVGEETNIFSYNDAFDISEYAISAMQWACGSGLIQGSSGNLMPRAEATRAQVAAIFNRFVKNLES